MNSEKCRRRRRRGRGRGRGRVVVDGGNDGGRW